MKRLLGVLMVMLLLICMPLQVSANSPPPLPYYIIELCELPEGTAYVDLLVYLPESDPYYTDLVEDNLPEGFSAQSEIVTYQESDFRSYTFHYADAVSSIDVTESNRVTFFGTDDAWEDISHSHKNNVEEKGEIRLAMLDEEGNILQLSRTFLLKSISFLGSIEGYFVYNGSNDTLEIHENASSFGYALYILLSFMGLLLTCLLEWLVALIMRLDKAYRIHVIKVNVGSQILMHALYIGLYSLLFWRYTVALVLLELLVYAGEFAIYHFVLMRELPTKKCLIFTVVANTVSLLSGILILGLL